MKYKLILIALWFVLSSIFLIQTFSSISILPISKAILILGLPTKAVGIFLLMFTGFAIYFIQYLIIEVTKKDSSKKKAMISFMMFMKAFLLVWVAFFSYGILATFKIFPSTVDDSQFLNWYIFWFFIFKFIGTTTYYLSKRYNQFFTYGSGGQMYRWPE